MRLLHRGEVPFPSTLKSKTMRAIASNTTSPEEVSVLNIRIGEFVASALQTFATEHDFSLATDIDLIGGPENVFVDAAVRYFTKGEREYDRDGALGAAGKVDQSIVDEVLSNPYFAHEISKTTGRETFGDTMAEDICKRMVVNGASPEDAVATITRVTAQSLHEHYVRYAPKPLHEVFMGGGGSYHPNIINYLREKMPETNFALIDELGIPAGAKEALGFALYTCEEFVGRPLMVPHRVESRREGVIGHVQPGENHFGLRRRVVEFWGL
ncbi:unnamed protein product [Zymoseptoria tritici ST99CH_1E4]|uniref:Uncharacterized protein n=1 Tax=Zymoseptoria tritici ST99CH_1E4 TaxID=1276532 RepID=A0A2H1FP56_ZYMTR|nr:unnamed protein product [Zymoseptoria tritici ST99CH_1E4]